MLETDIEKRKNTIPVPQIIFEYLFDIRIFEYPVAVTSLGGITFNWRDATFIKNEERQQSSP